MSNSTARRPDEWFTPTQAAPLLGMHPRTVRELCQDRRIRRRKMTGPAGQARYSICREAIDEFNRAREAVR